jgi:hypothetical protein
VTDRFEADVAALRSGAKELLGATIDDLSHATGHVRRTGACDDAFEHIDHGGGLFTGVGGQWTVVRDYLLRVFEDNTENLRLAQEALLEVADRYEEADQGSAAAMNRIANTA